jgi:mono/diheme cytochrome c family protein
LGARSSSGALTVEPTMRRIAVVVLGLALAGGVAAAVAMRSNLPPAERGRRLAERTGCFGCHGPGGTHGANNPGRLDKTVPNFQDDVMMYAKTPEEIREWIHNGVTHKKAASVTWRADRERGVLKMPAFRRRLGERDIDDLVAFVMASAGMPEPDDSLAARGLERAEQLGCVSCHGPGGRLARSNPGSLKGYVPSWDSADFPELVRDSTEFRQWIGRGVSRRLERNRLAEFFLRRAVLKMPAYEKHLEPSDVTALWAYVIWLRAEGSHATARPTEERRHE